MRVVGVVAPAGVGKSRLCYEFAAACRARRIPVHEASAVSHGVMIPFLPVLELLRSCFGIEEIDADETVRDKIAGRLVRRDPRLTDSLPLFFDFLGVPDTSRPVPDIDQEAQRLQLLGLVRSAVRGDEASGPMLLVIEDLHWLDGASEPFLEQMVEAVETSRTLLILNYRPEYRAAWMQHPDCQQIPLHPLGPEEMGEMLSDLLGQDESVRGLAEAIGERTQGNPFFMEEVVLSLVESGSLVGEHGRYRLVTPVERLAVPGTVHAVLAARIDRLREGDKRVLQTASAIGREFSWMLLRAVADQPDAELAAAVDALITAELLTERSLYPEPEYSFKHPLTHDVTLGSMLGERRAHLHARIADAIERLQPERLEEHAALLSHHREQAGQSLEAARWRRRAAHRAGRSDAPEALRHWERVHALAASEGDAGAELVVEACVWRLRFGWRVHTPTREEGEAIYREGRALAERGGDRESMTRLCAAYAFYLPQVVTDARGAGATLRHEALGLTQESIQIAGEIGDAGLALRLCPDWISTLQSLQRYTETVDVADRVVEQARADPALAGRVEQHRAYGFLLNTKALALIRLGRLRQAAECLERAERLARERGWEELIFWSEAGQATLATRCGEREAGLRRARAALERAERLGVRAFRAWAYSGLAEALLLAERFEEAIVAAEANLDLNIGLYRGSSVTMALAQAYMGLGDYQRAGDLLEEGVPLASRADTRWEGQLQITRARWLRLSRGSSADEEIEGALDRAERSDEVAAAPSLLPLLHIERAELARLRGDAGAARVALQEAHRLCTEMGATGHADRLALELARAES